MANIQLGESGTVLIVTVTENAVAKDLSAPATNLEIHLYSPEERHAIYEGSFTNDGSDGKIEITTVAEDLYMAGDWKIRAKFTLGGRTIPTVRGEFTVDP